MAYHRKQPDKSRAWHLLNRVTHPGNQRGVSVAARLVIGLVILIVIGTLLLMLPGVGAQRRLTLAEASFTATSALTVTGLSTIVPYRDLTVAGQTLLLLLIQIGGVGFMFVIVVTLQILGRRIYITDRIALVSSLGLDSSAAVLTLMQRVLLGVLTIELAGALLLWVNWLRFFPPAEALGYALFHAVSAFCNAGFDLFGGRPGFDGIPTDDFSLLVMGALILIGGLGIPVLSDLFVRRRQRFSLHTRLTLVVVAALTIFGWLGLLIAETSPGGVLHDAPLDQQLVKTLFQSISNRTAGFAGLPNFNALAPESILLIVAMMFVGCAPASMGGGITTGTFAVLIATVTSYAQGLPRIQAWGRTISNETVRRAGVVLTVSLGLLAVATWLLLATNPTLTFDEAFFEVVSAFATCGLSVGATLELNAVGRLIIMLMMFWGRLGPLTLVIAIAQRRDNTQQLVHYAEEQVLIG